jgi:hypothetical protein
MKKKFLLLIIIVSFLNANILDDTVNFWYVDKTYKKTKTYRFWKNKQKKITKKYTKNIPIINIDSNFVDNAVDFWYINKTYKTTQTYHFWENKQKELTKKYIKNIDSHFIDNAINFWYINKTYQTTQTYRFWENEKNLISKNYIYYKKENPYTVIMLESFVETSIIAINLSSVMGIGVTSSIPYMMNNYQYLPKLNLLKSYKLLKNIQPPQFLLKKNRLSNYERNLINSGTQIGYKRKRIIQRNIFKHSKHNLERMKKGKAPIGIDKKPVELHHLKQQDNGLIIEVLSKNEHKKEYSILHRYKSKSEINRDNFNTFRQSYWRNRAKTNIELYQSSTYINYEQ